jgi:hypothetical protein
MRIIVFCFLVLSLAGCAGNQPSVKYFDLTPTTVGAVVSVHDENEFGLSTKTEHLFEIDKEGNATLKWTGQASGVGPLQALMQGAVSSTANATVAGAVMGKLLPATSTTTNVTTK